MIRRPQIPRLALVVSLVGATGCGGSATTPPDSNARDAAADGSTTSPPDAADAGPNEMDAAADAVDVPDAVDATGTDVTSRDDADARALDASDATDEASSTDGRISTDAGVDGPDAAQDGDASDVTDGPPPPCEGLCSLQIASGPDWSVYDDDPTVNPAAQLLGPARHVCLNTSYPQVCPAGALIYTLAGVGWTASLAGIPNAHWIWSSSIAVTDMADLKRFVFVRTFTLGELPSGWISIAADDQAEIRVNGRMVGAVGSITDVSKASMSNSQLSTFDLAPFLSPGKNTISVVAQNGPPSFAGCATSCTYASNPAGTVFGGVLNYR